MPSRYYNRAKIGINIRHGWSITCKVVKATWMLCLISLFYYGAIYEYLEALDVAIVHVRIIACLCAWPLWYKTSEAGWKCLERREQDEGC